MATKTKKVYAPENISIIEALNGVSAGIYYASYHANAIANGFKLVKIALSTIKGTPIKSNLDYYRNVIQEVAIAADQRGNLAEFAGKNVEVIVHGISQNHQFELYIREKK